VAVGASCSVRCRLCSSLLAVSCTPTACVADLSIVR
jgi:hypothetical protein